MRLISEGKRTYICHYPDYIPKRENIDFVKDAIKDREYLEYKNRSHEREMKRLIESRLSKSTLTDLHI